MRELEGEIIFVTVIYLHDKLKLKFHQLTLH